MKAQNLTPVPQDEYATSEARFVEGGHVITDKVHGDLFVLNVRANARFVYFQTIPSETYAELSYEDALAAPRTTHKATLRTPLRFA